MILKNNFFVQRFFIKSLMKIFIKKKYIHSQNKAKVTQFGCRVELNVKFDIIGRFLIAFADF